MPKYALIIPVFNRPQEVDELLESLNDQPFKDFEVLVIEDGSTETCKHICDKYLELDIKYFFKENTGQGFSRNYGFERATADYFIQLDSDALVPAHYFEAVNEALESEQLDAFGGPDRADDNFTSTQKAINYAMTSLFTTGGIRGNKNNMGGKFTPRSFNFGLSRKVWEKVGGYKITRMGEDIEFSYRIIQAGFKVGLIPEAYIYHKRRTSLIQFFKQLHFFGRARINIARFFPEQLKLVHFFPLCFTLFILIGLISFCLYKPLFNLSFIILSAYFCLLFIDSLRISKSIWVAILSIPACFIQLFAYGLGFITEALNGKKNLE